MKYHHKILTTEIRKIEKNSMYSPEYIWLICKNALGGDAALDVCKLISSQRHL